MIADYNLACPTASDLTGSLVAILGTADADSALRVAMRDAGEAKTELDHLPPEQLHAVALALASQRGLPAVIGRSFAIRMTTYLHLKEAQHVAR